MENIQQAKQRYLLIFIHAQDFGGFVGSLNNN